MLNSVKPEHLLDYEDMSRLLSARETRLAREDVADEAAAEALAHWRDEAEGSWVATSSAAWHAVLFEVVKVYAMSRASPKALRGLLGMEGAEPWLMSEPVLTGSNLYSTPECVLLSWLTHHYAAGLAEHNPTRVTNFGPDLRSGMALLGLVASHSPFAADHIRSSLARMPPPERGHAADARPAVRLLLEVLRSLQLGFGITEEEILRPVQAEMAIFVYYLFTSLPSLLPRSAIEFDARLGERFCKSVSVTNPTPRRMVYEAQLEGALDFTLGAHSLPLEPRASASIDVFCQPTSSRPVEGRLVLSPQGATSGIAATLVFSLRSVVDVSSPLKTQRFEGRMYEMLVEAVEVDNPFGGDCDLFVSCLPHEVAPPPAPEPPPDKKADKKGAKRRTGQPADSGGGAAAPKGPQAALYPHPFGADRPRLKIRRGERATLQISYLPFTLGSHCMRLHFEDITYGSFQYEIHGEAALPAPAAPVKATVDGRTPSLREVPVPFTNSALEAAKRLFLERHPGAKNKAQAELVAPARKGADARPEVAEVTYGVEHSSPYVSVAPSLVLVSAEMAKKGAKLAPALLSPSGQPNMMSVTLTPAKGTGVYPARLTLTSAVDVRIVDVDFNAVSPITTAAAFEFECAARGSIAQDIPMVNPGDKTLVYAATFGGNTGANFSGPKEITVGAKSTALYRLTFSPRWMGRIQGEVVLKCPTGELTVWTLSGKASEPLAEAHVVLETQARVGTSKQLRVPNVLVDSDCTYDVSTELPCLGGVPQLTVRAGSAGSFDLTALPLASGLLRGSVTFTVRGGEEYVFFTVEVNSRPPDESGRAQLEAVAGRAALLQLPMGNPTMAGLDFAVSTDGPALFAPRVVSMKPSDTATMEVAFCPTAALDQTVSGQVRLLSPQLGEYRYGLSLKAKAAPGGAGEAPQST